MPISEKRARYASPRPGSIMGDLSRQRQCSSCGLGPPPREVGPTRLGAALGGRPQGVGSGVGAGVGSGVGPASAPGSGRAWVRGSGPGVGSGVGAGVGSAVAVGVGGRARRRSRGRRRSGRRVARSVAASRSARRRASVSASAWRRRCGDVVGLAPPVGSTDADGDDRRSGSACRTAGLRWRLVGAGVPVAESTPPAGRGQITMAATKARPRAPAAANTPSRGTATRRHQTGDHDRGRERVGLSIRLVARGVRGRRPGDDEPRRVPRSRTRPRLVRRASSSAAASARSGSLGAALGPGRGRPPQHPSEQVHPDGRVDDVGHARRGVPGRCAWEARCPFPASRSAVRRSIATATAVAATAMSARTGRSMGMSARC